jgi:ribonucleoside-diphosphate reductase subunit M1
MAVERGAFIDQSQSLNIYMSEPSFGRMTSMHFYAWRSGLKTGMYYLRSRPAADAIKFTVDVENLLVSGGLNTKSASIFINDENSDPTEAAKAW